jgi:hypothetical protein
LRVVGAVVVNEVPCMRHCLSGQRPDMRMIAGIEDEIALATL